MTISSVSTSVSNCYDLYKRLLELGTCNDCEKVKDCEYAPGWGQPVRYNCPFYERKEEKKEKRSTDMWKDLFKQARECMKNKMVEDWRPASNIFTDELKERSGIIMWMNNGDTIIYYPKEEKDEA